MMSVRGMKLQDRDRRRHFMPVEGSLSPLYLLVSHIYPASGVSRCRDVGRRLLLGQQRGFGGTSDK